MDATRGGLLRGAALVIACASFTPACGQPCELSSCDIRDESCHASVLEAVVCVRGGEPRTVPVRVVDADAYINEQARLASSREDAHDTVDWYAGLASLRLSTGRLEPGEAERTHLENVAGFYDPEDARVTVLDRGEALDGSVLLLAHEFVHALQDQEHDLGALHDAHGDTVDRSLALAAIIEGEATLYTDQLKAMSIGFDLDDVAWSSAFASYRERSRELAREQPEPILMLRSAFAYAYGASYVYEAWRADGNAAVRELLEMPPVSSRQVMSGLNAEPPDGQPWLDDTLDAEALPVLDSRFEVVGNAHLGSYALWIFLERWQEEQVDRDPLEQAPVRDLRADVLTVLRSADGETVVTWRMRFADEDGAARVIREIGAPFNSELQDDPGTRAGRAWSSGRDAFFVVAPQGALPTDAEALAWTAIPEPELPVNEEAAAASGRRFE